MGNQIREWAVRYRRSFSFVGLAVAAVFFAASLTPSLLPRNYLFEGLLAGFAIAIGYAIGVLLEQGYLFLGLPVPAEARKKVLQRVVVVLTTLVVLLSLWRMTYWQNSIRELMEMPPLESSYPLSVGGIAIGLAVVLNAAGRLFVLACRWVSGKLNRFLPPRVASGLGFLIVVFAAFFLANDIIARRLLDAADRMFAALDASVDESLAQPTDSDVCGSPDSFVPWNSIGRRGKDFLATGPTKESISQFRDQPAKRPVRVYVGLRSRPTKRLRAQLALEELKRVGGFERSVLVIATPTGTGWLDPSAVDTLEYLHGGDTAIVSMQYSYLPSWITILVDPHHSIDSARELFDEIYSHWTTLPKESRPKLYLHGLSLGSLGSEVSADLFTIFEDPIQGAVWSGPPFASRGWRAAVNNRNEDSPPWLPTFRDGRLLRFTSNKDTLDQSAPWGPMRTVYIQYASDPMIWFSPGLAWRSPDWLEEPRGPDVSHYLKWFPVVTFLQVAFDMPMATSVPIGYGHSYSPSSYIDAWLAVTEPDGWTEEAVAELKTHFRAKDAPKP